MGFNGIRIGFCYGISWDLSGILICLMEFECESGKVEELSVAALGVHPLAPWKNQWMILGYPAWLCQNNSK